MNYGNSKMSPWKFKFKLKLVFVLVFCSCDQNIWENNLKEGINLANHFRGFSSYCLAPVILAHDDAWTSWQWDRVPEATVLMVNRRREPEKGQRQSPKTWLPPLKAPPPEVSRISQNSAIGWEPSTQHRTLLGGYFKFKPLQVGPQKYI
jgi:hypothetical protein